MDNKPNKSLSENNCPECRIKKRDAEELRSLINRLKRIEGQIGGVIKMLENDAYCADVLTQTAAVSSAVSAFNKELLSSHIKTCVVDGIKHGDESKVEELVALMKGLMR